MMIKENGLEASEVLNPSNSTELEKKKPRNTRSYKTDCLYLEGLIPKLRERISKYQKVSAINAIIALIGWAAFIIALLK